MNNEQAKFILRAYRPSGRDAGDAAFCEALRQAQADPAVGAWFAREQAFDAAVAAKLRAAEPPAGLREAILTGAHLSAPVLRPRRRLPAWLAVAASVALIAGIAAAFRLIGVRPAAADRIARLALDEPLSAHTGPHADQLGTLGAWLQDPGHRLTAMPAVDLAQLKAEGCRTVTVAGHEVFEICFRHGSWYHLYLARARDFDVRAAPRAPVLLAEGERSVATWAGQGLVYVLMTKGGTDALERIL